MFFGHKISLDPNILIPIISWARQFSDTKFFVEPGNFWVQFFLTKNLWFKSGQVKSGHVKLGEAKLGEVNPNLNLNPNLN